MCACLLIKVCLSPHHPHPDREAHLGTGAYWDFHVHHFMKEYPHSATADGEQKHSPKVTWVEVAEWGLVYKSASLQSL